MRSEIARHTDSPAVDPAVAQVAAERRVAMRQHVVELDLHVGVPEPVQAGSHVVQNPAVEPVVVEIGSRGLTLIKAAVVGAATIISTPARAG